MVEVGLCMIQGARHAHIRALDSAAKHLNSPLVIHELRTREDVVKTPCDAYVLPGGESTVMRLTGGAEEKGGSGLLPALFEQLRHTDAAVLGTCAGAILLCDPQDGGEPLISAHIGRNAYGRQVDSFQSIIDSPLLSRSFPGVFIRAPRFESIGTGVEVAASNAGEPVGVISGRRLALTFHPELTEDFGFHTWLLSIAMDHPLTSSAVKSEV